MTNLKIEKLEFSYNEDLTWITFVKGGIKERFLFIDKEGRLRHRGGDEEEVKDVTKTSIKFITAVESSIKEKRLDLSNLEHSFTRMTDHFYKNK